MASEPSYTYNVTPDMSYLEEYFYPESRDIFAELVKSHKDFPWKDDDVVICSYPRSGTHLTWHIVKRIIEKSPDMPGVSVEEAAIDLFSFQDNQKGRRAFCAHALPYDFTDDVISNGHRKFIYVMRNPKDVLVSSFVFGKQFVKQMSRPVREWSTGVEEFASNFKAPTGRSWFDHVRAWAEYTDAKPDAPILPVWFEDIQQDRKATIRKISDFIGGGLSEETLDAICEGIQFQNLKKAPVSEILDTRFDKKLNYYRKGQVGDWKNHFTVAQSELLDGQVQKLLAGFKWKIVYE